MNNKLIVSPSPHIHGKDTTSRLMLDVVIALLPAFIMSAVVFGWSVLTVTAVSVACCVLFEYLIQKYMLKGPLTINNWSAVVTGMLLAFNLPSSIPLWMVAIGALVAIGVGKMTFGGLGKNPFNPALVGRVFLLLSFPAAMTSFPELVEVVETVAATGATATTGATITDAVSGATLTAIDAMSGATPLTGAKAAIASGIPASEVMEAVSYKDYLLGFKSGSLGEVSAIALLVGFVYLLFRKVISWRIPVFVLGTIALFTCILWMANPAMYMSPVFHLLTGGAILGAVYMATDYSTSPMTTKGMLIFGVGIGVITVLIRVWGAYPEGMSFAILIMNAFVPLIDKYVKPRRFGAVKKARS